MKTSKLQRRTAAAALLMTALLAGGRPAFASCEVADLAIPLTAGPGAPKEARVLHDGEAMKVVALILRQGTVLTDHAADTAVSIQTVSGTGTLKTETQSFALKPGAIQVLSHGERHAVTPSAGGDLVLLVTYLKGKGTADAAPHHH